MKKLGVALLVSLMTTAAVAQPAQTTIFANGRPDSLVGGLTGTTLAAGLGALLLIGVLLGGSSSTTTTTTTTTTH